MTERECYNARREMLDHLGDLLRTQVLKKEKELIDKQLEEAERQAKGEFVCESVFRIIYLLTQEARVFT